MDKMSLLRMPFRVCFLMLATFQICQSNPVIDKSPTLIDAGAPNSMEVQASNTNHTQSRQSADPEFDSPMYHPTRPSFPTPDHPDRPKLPRPTRKPEGESFWSYLNPVASLKKIVEIVSGETEEEANAPKPSRFSFRRPAFMESLRRNNPGKPQSTYNESSEASVSNNTSQVEEATLPTEIQARIIDQIMASFTTEASPPVQGSFPSPMGYGTPLTNAPQYSEGTGYLPIPNPALPAITPYPPNNAVFPFPTAPSLVAVRPVPDLEFRSLFPLLESGVLP